MIQQISETEFRLERGGHTMTLSRDEFGWHMFTENACTRAWDSLGFRRFSTLADVEKHYKSWRGLSALVNA